MDYRSDLSTVWTQQSSVSDIRKHEGPSANRSSPSVVRNAGQMALPAAGYSPTSAAPSVANANAGAAGQVAVPRQRQMSDGQVTEVVNARSAAATDSRGNTLYLQQVLQQIQQNPDPKIIENLAEALHESKI